MVTTGGISMDAMEAILSRRMEEQIPAVLDGEP